MDVFCNARFLILYIFRSSTHRAVRVCVVVSRFKTRAALDIDKKETKNVKVIFIVFVFVFF